MAHSNINERRFHVAQLLSNGVTVDTTKKRDVARLFGCHVSAIYADCKHFKKHGWHWELAHGIQNGFPPIVDDLSEIYTLDEFRNANISFPTDIRILEFFDSHPEQLYSLAPREFEEFVASLLDGFGYTVTLGPKGPDQGVDIFAERQGQIGSELMLVQCKRFSAHRKVSRPVVQQLSACVYDRAASSGLVVTTSHFSEPALQYISQAQYRLRAADKLKLTEWIEFQRRQRLGGTEIGGRAEGRSW
jgi:restriction system protein